MSGRAELHLGEYQEAVDARLARWDGEDFGRRLWAKDHSVWSPAPIPELTDRLGWLELPVTMRDLVGKLTDLARKAADEGIRDVVVLGMGGSSLAPEVFARTFGAAPGFPAVSVLDSTHPDAVRALAGRLDLRTSLFLVSSKSGTTTETLSFFRYFWDALAPAGDARGHHFVAITDPETSLQKLAFERGFRAVVNAPEDVGGRYSALTPFGLVPAALLGIDLGRLLASGQAMAEACGAGVPAASNPGLVLGAAPKVRAKTSGARLEPPIPNTTTSRIPSAVAFRARSVNFPTRSRMVTGSSSHPSRSVSSGIGVGDQTL